MSAPGSGVSIPINHNPLTPQEAVASHSSTSLQCESDQVNVCGLCDAIAGKVLLQRAGYVLYRALVLEAMGVQVEVLLVVTFRPDLP